MRSWALICLVGCGTAESAPVLAPVRLTPKLAAACGPDYLERHATSIADLDHDGVVDRPSLTRTADAIVVKLHQLPTLREHGSWKLLPANAYLEVATPRRRGSRDGDLWVMLSTEPAPKQWVHTLQRLDATGFTTLTSKHLEYLVRVDVDGDGRVDPLAFTSDPKTSKVQALVAGDRWIDVPASSPSTVHGAPTQNGQEEAIDLDGNGVRELVLERDDAVVIVETPAMKEIWRAPGKPWHAGLVSWAGAWVLGVWLDDKLRIFTTDAKHVLVAELPVDGYTDVAGTFATRLFVNGTPWHVFDRARPAKSIATTNPLLGRLDGPFGPTRIGANPASFATLGSLADPIELRLVNPTTLALGRTVWKTTGRSRVEEDTHGWLVDLDRDGTSEVLLEHVTRTRMHHGASWNTAKLALIDGAGKLLWQEASARTDEWVHENGKMRQTRRDDTHVRAFDLGDGTMPLRIRSAGDEYYLLAAGSKLAAIPACLE